MRFFLTLLFVFALSTSARAQQPAKVSKIGFLGLMTRSSVAQLYAAFRQRLQELGYLEGQSIVIESRWADGRAERLPELALELVRLRVEVIVVGLVEPALAARAATTAVPIVFTSVADPVAFGLVTNLARRGGNITGLTAQLFCGIRIIQARWSTSDRSRLRHSRWASSTTPQVFVVGCRSAMTNRIQLSEKI